MDKIGCSATRSLSFLIFHTLEGGLNENKKKKYKQMYGKLEKLTERLMKNICQPLLVQIL